MLTIAPLTLYSCYTKGAERMRARLIVPIRLGFLALALLLFGITGSAQAAMRVVQSNETFTVENQFIGNDACPNSEAMVGNGTVHVHGTTVYDDDQGVHFNFMTNLQGFTGVGQTTGTHYRITDVQIGNQQVVPHVPENSAISTFISTAHIVGSGPNNNLLARGILHITSDENGEIIALVDRFDIFCT